MSTWEWVEIEPAGELPEPRSGHQVRESPGFVCVRLLVIRLVVMASVRGLAARSEMSNILRTLLVAGRSFL